MAKPIFTIGLPISATDEAVIETAKALNLKLTDYHVLIYKTSKIEDIKFELFSVENVSDIEIEDLIELTNDILQKK